MNLTKALLTLDKESRSELKNENSADLNEKQNANNFIQKLKDETIALFENEKIEESTQLDLLLEQERVEAIDDLRQKMRKYNENVDIDALAEHLYQVAKERVCP